MKVRTLGLGIPLVVALLAAPVVVEAQQAAKVWRIGLLGLSAVPEKRIDAFRQALSEGGYVGMQLLVQALKQVGPTVTRAALTVTAEIQESAADGVIVAQAERPKLRS